MANKWESYNLNNKKTDIFKLIIECEEEFMDEIMTHLLDYGHIIKTEKLIKEDQNG